MAARKRILKKLPDFRLGDDRKLEKEEDLKQVKEEVLKNLKEKELNATEWYDQELDKNLRSQ